MIIFLSAKLRRIECIPQARPPRIMIQPNLIDLDLWKRNSQNAITVIVLNFLYNATLLNNIGLSRAG